MKDEKKYEKRYNCTRNQYRRIIQGAPYSAGLDGGVNEYNKRKKLIMASQPPTFMLYIFLNPLW